MGSYLPRVVMITGATGGLGSAFTQRFADAGCKLILTSRHPGKLKELTSPLRVPHHQIIMDIRHRVEIEEAFRSLPQEFQEIDCLINNAGGAFGLEPAFAAKLDDWQEMIEANNVGLVVTTHQVLKGMVERKRGHIINIGSIAGSYPYPGGSVYCAVKAFVMQFSLSLRADLIGSNVRVTNIEPGMVETDFSLNRFKGDAEKAAKVYEGADALQAEDVADMVFFAASQPERVNINRIEVMPTTQGPSALSVYRR